MGTLMMKKAQSSPKMLLPILSTLSLFSACSSDKIALRISRSSSFYARDFMKHRQSSSVQVSHTVSSALSAFSKLVIPSHQCISIASDSQERSWWQKARKDSLISSALLKEALGTSTSWFNPICALLDSDISQSSKLVTTRILWSCTANSRNRVKTQSTFCRFLSTSLTFPNRIKTLKTNLAHWSK